MDWELIARCINSIVDNFFKRRTEHMRDVSLQAMDNIDVVVEKVCDNAPKYVTMIQRTMEQIDAIDTKPAEVSDEELPN